MIKRKPMSEETKRKIGKSNKGKKRTKEQKHLISSRTKEAMENVNVWNKGMKWSKEKIEEEREKQKRIHKLKPEISKRQAELAIERWKNKEYRDKVTNSIRESRIDYVPWNKGLPPQKQPGWRGGISCEPYCDSWLDLDYKKSIKERDDYKCQNPNCSGNYKRLSIHHIDYNKKNCFPDNLITLCNPCNSKANQNREFWCLFYKKILEESEMKEDDKEVVIESNGIKVTYKEKDKKSLKELFNVDIIDEIEGIMKEKVLND